MVFKDEMDTAFWVSLNYHAFLMARIPSTTVGTVKSAHRRSSRVVNGGVATTPADWRMNKMMTTELKTTVNHPNAFISLSYLYGQSMVNLNLSTRSLIQECSLSSVSSAL